MYKNYITGQDALTFDLNFGLPENHLATIISNSVDSIPDEVML